MPSIIRLLDRTSLVSELQTGSVPRDKAALDVSLHIKIVLLRESFK